VVSVTIAALNQLAESVMDVLYQTVSGLDVETAAGPDGNTAQVGAHSLALRDHGPHHVTRLETKALLLRVRYPRGKPCFVRRVRW